VARHGYVEGLGEFLASDVVYLRAGAPPVYGASVVRRLLASTGRMSPPTWVPLGGGVSDDLRSGYTWGIAAHDGTAQSAVQVERYIAYWQRAAAQPWRVVAYAEVGGPTVGDVMFATPETTAPRRTLPKPIDDARAHVRDADSLFSDLSYRMGAGFAFASTVADDGVIFGSPALVIGPRAVKEYFETRGEPASLTWQPVYASVAGSRDLAFTIGESVTTARGPSGAAVQRFGKYLTVWRKQRDGSWKFVVDGGNPSPAPAR
jgi:ketosteroid isomerase-like protein